MFQAVRFLCLVQDKPRQTIKELTCVDLMLHKNDPEIALWVSFIGLTAILTMSAAPDLGTVFAPPSCAYAVSFPLPPDVRKKKDEWGHRAWAADLVHDGVRFSAICIETLDAPLRAPPVLTGRNATTPIERIARALGVQGAAPRPLGQLGPDCKEVEGALAAENSAYRISAKICLSATSTFIAETVYPSESQYRIVQTFMDSVRAK